MTCILHCWLISRAADARRAVARITQNHLAACAECRAYAELCLRLPQALAAGVPAGAATRDTVCVQQRILAQTVHAPVISKVGKRTVVVFPSLGKIAEIFSNPWKPAIAALAAACLLLGIGLNRQHANRIQRENTLAALQDVRLACDAALQRGPTRVVGGWLDAAAQSLVTDAAAAVNTFGSILQTAAVPDRS